MSIKQVLYRAQATATGGREGRAVSSDNVLDVKLTTPKELGGNGAVGTNPEQLFAAGYSACFIGAIETGFGIEVELKISLPGMERAAAEALVAAAHIVCPYSNATRGNIDVTLTIV